jgi:hypothetical protein
VIKIARLAARAVILAGMQCALSACTALPSVDSPEEYLDPNTAATISVVGRPLVFAHAQPNLAAHMRDYVTLAAAAVNRSGKTEYVVIAYFWTTLDAHGQEGAKRTESNSAADTLILVADDRRIELPSQGHSAHAAGIGMPVHAPPVRSATPNVYRTDLATLRFIAAARHLAVLRSAEDPDSAYEIWEDRRAALGQLVGLLNGAK